MSNAAIHDRAPRAMVHTRIGIVSHPHHRDPSRWHSLRLQMASIFEEHGGRGAEAVTLLAADTDRLFATVARERGARLSLVIPSRDFPRFFATPDALSEYIQLRTLAHSRTILDHATFDRESFQDASKFIVDTCDVLVVVGTGFQALSEIGSGGIVQYARDKGKLLVWIDPEAPIPMPPLSLVR